MRREIQIIKGYAIHTMLTPSTHIRTVHLVVFMISTHLCRSKPKLICFDEIQQTQSRASTVEPQLAVFFNPQILRTISFGYNVKHPPNSLFPFPVWGFIITDDDCHILSARLWEVTIWLWHLNKETLSSSKPYQTK